MRNYGSRHVRNRVVYERRVDSVCPFPGKYPLRLVWKVESQHHPELNASYFGKFLPSAWKRFVVLSNEAAGEDMFAKSQFSLFDRGGELTSGSAFNNRAPGPTATLRYFPYENFRNRDYLRTARPFACGPYWIYCTEPLNEREIAHTRRQIETAIPTLRNR